MAKIESHNTEFKESWRDEYLKAICAFANTKGGDLMIGIDDSGKPKALADKKKLLEDLPNKIKESLNIVADVQLKKKASKEYINIKVKPYENPISYRGKFYTRSGSTTQEINNSELQRFLLNKSNTAWESLTEEGTVIENVDEKSVLAFKEIAKAKSLPAGKERTTTSLLTKLHLVEKGKLMRAGILLFGKNPQQFFPGSFIKVGRFSKDEDLLNGEEIKGNLFNQAERTLEVLKSKYLVSGVEIKGLYRTENLEYPEAALREAIVNAIAHKDYSGSHIQIKVYPDKLTFWNPGVLPQGLTVALLKKAHPSHPHNKLIADTFHDAGLIERWGHGTVKMVKECIKAGLPEPSFEEFGGGLLVTFTKDIFSEEYLVKKGVNDRQIKAIQHVKRYGAISNNEYQEITGAIKRTATRDLAELVQKNLVTKTGSTGKGTIYTLTGHKGDKGDIKAQRGQKKELDELDNKLLMFERDLNKLDPNEEIKGQFSKKMFFEIYDSWLSELLIKAITIAQKFNRFFAEPTHALSAINGYWSIGINNENPQTLVRIFRENAVKSTTGFDNRNLIVQMSLYYNSFKRAGLKTFSCSYHLEIAFNSIGYKIFLSENSSGGMPSREAPQLENLLHKEPTERQIDEICKKLGDDIYNQIEQKTSEMKNK